MIPPVAILCPSCAGNSDQFFARFNVLVLPKSAIFHCAKCGKSFSIENEEWRAPKPVEAVPKSAEHQFIEAMAIMAAIFVLLIIAGKIHVK